jgi:hypothetical protein
VRMNNNSKDGIPTFSYPHTFLCGNCNKKHTALAFSDAELDYINFILSIHRESLIGMIEKKRSRRERRYLKSEIEVTDHLAEKVNFKEYVGDSDIAANVNVTITDDNRKHNNDNDDLNADIDDDEDEDELKR